MKPQNTSVTLKYSLTLPFGVPISFSPQWKTLVVTALSKRRAKGGTCAPSWNLNLKQRGKKDEKSWILSSQHQDEGDDKPLLPRTLNPPRGVLFPPFLLWYYKKYPVIFVLLPGTELLKPLEFPGWWKYILFFIRSPHNHMWIYANEVTHGGAPRQLHGERWSPERSWSPERPSTWLEPTLHAHVMEPWQGKKEKKP